MSIRITSGTELADAHRTQPHPVHAWITTELFIGIAPQIAHMYIQISKKEIYTCRRFCVEKLWKTRYSLKTLHKSAISAWALFALCKIADSLIDLFRPYDRQLGNYQLVNRMDGKSRISIEMSSVYECG